MLPKGFTIKFEGRERAVAFDDSLWATMGEILPKTRARIEALMRAYCEHGPQNIPPAGFKFEIQYEEAGKKTRVEAFKGRHVRFYGTCGHLGGRPVFLVTGCDTSKKSDAADRKKLIAAGKRGHQLIHEPTAANKSKTKSKGKRRR